MAVTIKDGKEQSCSIDEIRMLLNAQTRYIPDGQEIKIVTCDANGFQQVFWVNTTEYRELNPVDIRWTQEDYDTVSFFYAVNKQIRNEARIEHTYKLNANDIAKRVAEHPKMSTEEKDRFFQGKALFVKGCIA